MDQSVYIRPNKPRRMAVTKRERVPEREPFSVPIPPTVHASTECFTTPGPVIDLMIEHADIEDGHALLEPSAGTGAIADRLKENCLTSRFDVFELDSNLREFLKAKGYKLRGSNFLEFEAKPEYDRILMNPPFRKLQDIDHVRKAYDCLKPGGRLVGIMGAGAFFNYQKKAAAFREWFDDLEGEVYDLPENSFKDSGTGVNAKIIILDKE